MVPRIPVLSLHRPWPALIMRGGKDVENRDWATKYRGPVLIAAGLGWDKQAMPYARQIASLDRAVPDVVGRPLADILEEIPDERDAHPTGIVGVVILDSVCAESTRATRLCRTCSWWGMPGRKHWRIRDQREFASPVPHRGRQRLWTVDEAVWPAVAMQLDAAIRRQPTPV